MPIYEFKCRRCLKEFSLTLTLKERDQVKIQCPSCHSEEVEPLLSRFYTKTACKS